MSLKHNSPPIEKINNYYIAIIRDNEENILYEGLVLGYNYEYSKKVPNYLIYKHLTHLFLDVPLEIEIDEATRLDLIRLTQRNSPVYKVAIEDIKTPYIKVSSIENQRVEGWSGEKVVFKIHGSQPSEQAYDIVLLMDGFDSSEVSTISMEALMQTKFGVYTKQYVLSLLDTEPYKSLKEYINIWVIVTPSLDSGVSHLIKNIHKKTVYEAVFGAGCSERLLIVGNAKRALNFASEVPFDQIIVLVNSKIYGGSGGESLSI